MIIVQSIQEEKDIDNVSRLMCPDASAPCHPAQALSDTPLKRDRATEMLLLPCDKSISRPLP